ncbi:MAG: GTPase [Planctomycetota bacterium]|jgi:tRNA modification GTPase
MKRKANNLLACVTTAKGTGAISSIQLTGPSAPAIFKEIFRPTDRKKADFKTGSILTGHIIDGQKVIDQVVAGFEDTNNIVIHSHANPIIVEMVMKLLISHGAEAIDAEQMLRRHFAENDGPKAIETEAKLAQLKAVALEGVRIIANQPHSGLGKTAAQWLASIDSIPLQDITQQCRKILKDSKIANLIISGCKVVIAGPPNSGKSTLLNCLAGRQKAIVADLAGTTRDWVSARCRTDRLLMELIDTAGIRQSLSNNSKLSRQAQSRAADLVAESDLVLFVLDGSSRATAEELTSQQELFVDKKVLLVLNKLDLGINLDEKQLNFDFVSCVRISAKSGDRIEGLLKKIPEVLDVSAFDLNLPVCFTQRQSALLKLLSCKETKAQAKAVITEMLFAHKFQTRNIQ